MNRYFNFACMPVVSSNYWNEVHGNTPAEVEQDLEGMQTMRQLGRNMAWMLKCISAGTAIPAKGHSYDDGVVTKEATETEEGIKTYTCTICGATKTESIPKITVEKTAPKVTLSVAAASNGKIALTGKYEDYENASKSAGQGQQNEACTIRRGIEYPDERVHVRESVPVGAGH